MAYDPYVVLFFIYIINKYGITSIYHMIKFYFHKFGRLENWVVKNLTYHACVGICFSYHVSDMPTPSFCWQMISIWVLVKWFWCLNVKKKKTQPNIQSTEEDQWLLLVYIERILELVAKQSNLCNADHNQWSNFWWEFSSAYSKLAINLCAIYILFTRPLTFSHGLFYDLMMAENLDLE